MQAIAVLALLVGIASTTVYFEDDFSDEPFASERWVQSDVKPESGDLEWSGGQWGPEDRNGIRTTQDGRIYLYSAQTIEFDNADTASLAFGFTVKYEQDIDCAAGSAKLFPPGINQTALSGSTAYALMFGPAICGNSTKQVHAVVPFEGTNLLIKDDIRAPVDKYTHSYLIIINKDSTFEVQVDGVVTVKGNMKDHWHFEAPRMINVTEENKPADWVDNEFMDDPFDKKPEDWDVPEKIPDPEAEKPEDWDDEDDGEWEAPTITNSEYKGEWRARQIQNPAYKGPWEQAEIDNPDYVEAQDVYQLGPIGYVGIDVLQMKSGTVFSNFILTDNAVEAADYLKERKPDLDEEKAAKAEFEKQQSN